MRPTVEIALPVHNEERALEGSVRRLHAFCTESLPWSFRIVIADNASADGTGAIAERLAAELDAPGLVARRRRRPRLHGRRLLDRPRGAPAAPHPARLLHLTLLPGVADQAWFFDTDVRTALEDLRGIARLGGELSRFALVGVASAILYLLLFLALRGLTAPLAANAVALALSAAANTAANRRFTFGRRGRAGLLTHHVQGLIVFGFCLGLTTVALAGLGALAPGASRAVGGRVARIVGVSDASSPAEQPGSSQRHHRPHAPRLSAVRREGERVTPLELFFDLVFVLAITECTSLMSHHPSWSGMAQGLLVLGVLWWAWAAYAWLTSVIDPEAGPVRLVFFAAMASMLIAAICVPEAFGDLALAFALAVGFFRVSHIALFTIASSDAPDLRRSTVALAVSTAIAVGLLAAASAFDGLPQAALWVLALALDFGGPYFFGVEGWQLVPGHFAERHGLIVIIALGESIVEIGAGAAGHLNLGIGVAAVLGVGVAAALWWIYFDVVALISAQRLGEAEPGRVQNALARDSYSYIHVFLVAGIVLTSFGLKTVIAHTGADLDWVTGFALLGGIALYLLGLVAFRYRQNHTWNRNKLILAPILLALVPVATAIPALASLAIATALLALLVVREHVGYDERRDRLRARNTMTEAEAELMANDGT
jgi:low temperature requirement protein LtrA/putative flippase GtrA